MHRQNYREVVMQENVSSMPQLCAMSTPGRAPFVVFAQI